MASDDRRPSSRPAAPRRIVVPVDGSASSIRSVPLASRLAAELDCELVIVSIVTDFRSEAPARVERIDDLLGTLPSTVERRIVQARTVAPTIAQESDGGLVCIATTADPFDADGIRHTVTDGLIAAATSPVVVVGPKCDPEPTFERITVAIDPSHEQAGLAYWSTWLAYQLGVEVDFVHVSVDESRELGPKVREVTPDKGQSVAERLIIEAAGGVLAMGSHGRTGFHRLIQGSVGAAVIPRSTVPVLMLGPNVERAADDG